MRMHLRDNGKPASFATAVRILTVMFVLGSQTLNAAEPVPIDNTQTVTKTLFHENDFDLATERAGRSYTIVTRDRSGKTRRIEMADTPWNVESVRQMEGGNFVVDLPQSDQSHGLYIVSGSTGALADYFRCFQPAYANDGKAMVFVSWYPTHFAPENLTSEYVMLYDFRKSPSANRHIRGADFPLKDVADRRVGLQLYPRFQRITPEEQTGAAAVHRVSDLGWLPGTSKVIFYDEDTSEITSSEIGTSTNPRWSHRLPARNEQSIVVADVLPHGIAVSRGGISVCGRSGEVNCEVDVRSARPINDDDISVSYTRGNRGAHEVSVRLIPYQNLPYSR